MFKVNEYFSGNVMSIAFNGDNLPATVGVMAPGDYEFGTSERETMTVISGTLSVTLPGSSEAKTFETGDSFVVDANQTFQVVVAADTAYLCSYG